MADASHLERMGRELKCPICLSLLHSAVSLTCNHVFCNSCLEKSMRSAFNCPVCKVPYRRREIRPAPHMDNLVSVYKSMEVASGINIFVSQPAASSQKSGKVNQACANMSEAQDKSPTHADTLLCEHPKQHRRKGSNSESVTYQRSSRNSEEPSFPAKKRVQVPLLAASEAEMTHAKMKNETVVIDGKKLQQCPVLQKNMPSTCEKGESKFYPFFWLRDEENSEKSSEQTDDSLPMYTPPDVPCFSDIKDSNDELPCCISPKNDPSISSRFADLYDSEMFDWTQRPCSPELCSSPLATKVEDSDEQDEHSQKADIVLTEANTWPIISCRKIESLGKKSRRMISKTSNNQAGVRTSNIKVSDATGIRKGNRAKYVTAEAAIVHCGTNKLTHLDMQEGRIDSPPTFKPDPIKTKKDHAEAKLHDKIVPTLSYVTEAVESSNETAFGHPLDLKNLRGNNKRSSLKSGKSKSAKKVKFGDKKCFQEFENSNGDLTTEREENSGKMPNSLHEEKCVVEGISIGTQHALPFSTNDVGMGGPALQTQDATGQSRVDVAKVDEVISSPVVPLLLKCSTSARTICCAFCGSSEETEASGTMLCYLNGKLLTEIQNEGMYATNVHKKCAEWAPNVYFEDNSIINLEAELSRSRRIRCSVCGMKGAALGCYEKSCRKSFHVPCASLTSECRWDSENFVMLCPTHASSQLPCESLQTQSKRRRESATKRKFCVGQTKSFGGFKSGSAMHWISNKFKDSVLCCSALTDEEKAIVIEFRKLSGARILKNWDSVVTHVIASTDENGACKRTLKFLMGVLDGKWILGVNWIKACMQAGGFVEEQQFEISVDIHGLPDGPRLGRLRLLKKEPRLFEGYAFLFMNDFVPSYKGYLHDLVIAAGGKVLNRKPVAGTDAAMTFIVYSLETPDTGNPAIRSSIVRNRRCQAEALARSTGSLLASNSWILNSIAGYRLQQIEQ